MGFWALFWIWVGVGIFSLVVFALVGYSLFQSGKAVARQAAKLLPTLEKLQRAIDEPAQIEAPGSNMNDDPQIHIQARKRLLRNKAKKREDRQRRLIKRLNQFDPTESRFQ
ncbi:hypothetical protein [Rhodoluna sp.]|uniref:hypothetical protein n=1 Tax=Rhodoluna sp. TaxID=1969481 RepID=UPI0025EF662D|nr:hypothetical protein [Rhodoluna sp.]